MSPEFQDDRDFRRLVVANDSGRPANLLQLLFAVRRGSLELVRTEPPLDPEKDSVPDNQWSDLGDNRALRLLWNTPIPPRTSVVVIVRAPGERLVPLSQQWLSSATDGLLELDASEDHRWTTNTSYSDQFCWRKEQAALGPWTPAKSFFNRLDQETLDAATSVWTPALGEVDERRKALQEIGDYLYKGFVRRWGGDPNPYGSANAVEPPTDVQEELRMITRIFAESLNPFGLPNAVANEPLEKRLDMEGVKDAFSLFSCGALMLAPGSPTTRCEGVTPNSADQLAEFMYAACQPNSGNHVLFAELADACVRHGVEPGFWGALKTTLVHSIRQFARTYGSPNGPVLFDEFVPLEGPSDCDVIALRSERQQAEAARGYLNVWPAYLKKYIRI